MAYFVDGMYAIVAGTMHGTTWWSPATSEPLMSTLGPTPTCLYSTQRGVYSANGQSVSLLDERSGGIVMQFSLESESMSLWADEDKVIVGGSDSTVAIFDIRQAQTAIVETSVPGAVVGAAQMADAAGAIQLCTETTMHVLQPDGALTPIPITQAATITGVILHITG